MNSNKSVIVRTIGDLWKSYHLGCDYVLEECQRDQLSRIETKLEEIAINDGSTKCLAIQKLIAIASLSKWIDRADVVNMKGSDFVTEFEALIQ